MEPNDTHEHCFKCMDMRLECLHAALESAVNPHDLDEVLSLAECYFEFVLVEQNISCPCSIPNCLGHLNPNPCSAEFITGDQWQYDDGWQF